MRVEFRAITRRDLKFDSGNKIPHGSIIYVEETPHGWLGSYYADATKLGCSCFALDPEDFSLMTGGEAHVEELVLVAEEPEDPEEARQRAELSRRRIESAIRRCREEADRLQQVLDSL